MTLQLAMAIFLWIIVVFVGAIIVFVLFDWLRTWIYLFKENRRLRKKKTFDTATDSDPKDDDKPTMWDYEAKKKHKREPMDDA